MNYTKLLGLLLLPSLWIACQDEPVKEVTSTYPNGTPMVAQHVHYLGDSKQIVGESRFFPNGQLEVEGTLNQGARQGTWSYYKPDGLKWMEETYANNRLHGPTRVWYQSGELNYKGQYDQGKPHGTWVFYTPDGKKSKEVSYEHGQQKHSKSF